MSVCVFQVCQFCYLFLLYVHYGFLILVLVGSLIQPNFNLLDYFCLYLSALIPLTQITFKTLTIFKTKPVLRCFNLSVYFKFVNVRYVVLLVLFELGSCCLESRSVRFLWDDLLYCITLRPNF